MDKSQWGKTLRELRLKKGLSVAAAADLHKVADSTWQNWEAGKTKPHEYLIVPLLAKWPEMAAK